MWKFQRKHNHTEVIHVYPLDDQWPHELQGENCKCKPRKEVVTNDQGEVVGLLIIHNSYDGREWLENKYQNKIL